MARHAHSPNVKGFCPMGCGETLYLSDGFVMCGVLDCSCPTAVGHLLADEETEHVVRLEAYTFSVQHPLRERLEGALFDCPVHAFCQEMKPDDIGPPGDYRVTMPHGDDGVLWTPL